MTVKKICRALGTFCVLAAMLVTGLCVNADRIANLSTTGYESNPHPTICDDILILKKTGNSDL